MTEIAFAELYEWFEYDLKKWSISKIEIDHPNEILENFLNLWKFPIADYITFRLCWHVAVFHDFMSNMFHGAVTKSTFILVGDHKIFFEDKDYFFVTILLISSMIVILPLTILFHSYMISFG